MRWIRKAKPELVSPVPWACLPQLVTGTGHFSLEGKAWDGCCCSSGLVLSAACCRDWGTFSLGTCGKPTLESEAEVALGLFAWFQLAVFALLDGGMNEWCLGKRTANSTVSCVPLAVEGGWPSRKPQLPEAVRSQPAPPRGSSDLQ